MLALPNDIALTTANLPSGYHRDLQLLKELLFPALHNLRHCLQMAHLMLSNVSVKENILADEKYKYLFSVEEVNKLVLSGVPFRDAYKKVGLDIEQGTYSPSVTVQHTHEGSIGNLCLEDIKRSMDQAILKFNFKNVHESLKKLLD
jgi:argininosuccinate lyase